MNHSLLLAVFMIGRYVLEIKHTSLGSETLHGGATGIIFSMLEQNLGSMPESYALYSELSSVPLWMFSVLGSVWGSLVRMNIGSRAIIKLFKFKLFQISPVSAISLKPSPNLKYSSWKGSPSSDEFSASQQSYIGWIILSPMALAKEEILNIAQTPILEPM